jgi:hypothetical protein
MTDALLALGMSIFGAVATALAIEERQWLVAASCSAGSVFWYGVFAVQVWRLR